MDKQIRDDERAYMAEWNSGIMRRFFMLLAGGLLSFFFLTVCGRALAKGKSQQAEAADDESKMARLKGSAIAGDPEQQLRLGIMYAAGVEGWIDHRGAIFWLRKAAEQGEPNAQMLTAMMYLEGLGVRRSYMQAARWARLSALHGNMIAQLLMGAFLEDGVGVRRDLERAAYWYRYAANNPVEIGARQRLGTLYLEGKGVPQDTAEGLKWLNEAAEMGDANACFQLGMLYYDGRLVERDYEKALNWYLQAAEAAPAEKGSGAIEMVLGAAAVPGEAYTRTIGQIMKRNPHVVRDAQFYVGLMYETGRGTEQDMEQSGVWYQKAADAGDEIARQRLVFLKNAV
ncbi:sel1 repeat family protein [Oxalobacter sp. OttesenSCG-928-P03]|nr:sel1 repeat family protein [Oxalobacter sp. OttesenSCG-928-P03]